MTTMNRNFELKGRHVLAILLGFFGVVLAANLIYVYVALESFRGLSTESPYRKGLAYNQTIAAGRAQQAAGWHVNLSATPAADAIVVEETVQDRDGQAIGGLSISGSLRHPVDEKLDHGLTFKEAAPGHYRARLAAPLHGQWNAVVEARRGNELVYRREQRLWLK